MEDVIKKYLCINCENNKCKNCMKIRKEYKDYSDIYYCQNYKLREDIKIIGYTEKWIDSISINLEINKFR